MANAKHAFPEIDIVCRDRVRSFCLNLAAFRALEDHMVGATGNPDYSVLSDFDWNARTIKRLSLIVWAGLISDAEANGELLTIKQAEDIVSLVGLTQVRACIDESLRRVLTDEQREALEGRQAATAPQKKTGNRAQRRAKKPTKSTG